MHNKGEAKVHATRYAWITGWRADPETFTVRMDVPLEANSEYLMYVEILALGSPCSILLSEEIPLVEIYFSTNEDDIGEATIIPRELVVVSEFSYHVIMIVSAVIGTIIAMSRTGLLTRFYPAGN